MDVICDSPTRLSARQLCESVRERAPGVNDATVYRNLHFLSERGLIRPHEHDGHAFYELAGPLEPHHHLTCRGCGIEIEAPHDVTHEFYALLEERFGFRVTSDHLALQGWCAACRASGGT